MPDMIVVYSDVESVLSQISADDLIEELRCRDCLVEDQWEAIYAHLCQGRDAEAISIMKKMVQEKTGRIIP